MKRDHYLALGLIAVVLGGAAWMANKPYALSESDIATLKTQIRDEYAKRPDTRIEAVEIIKKSDTEAVGFAKIVSGGTAATHACQVTMNPQTSAFVWSCKP